ncbi:malto-oligosyltrehalose synthase [Luteipulveratus flavus]|uniref:Malto-oligosyltrehalose synthase n=1 Tax=Luteipulveratus flavus TaxID=3031728 RepID=A0ABT6CB31_9MICO|nr:malto-oligosyltrehalose synthase [Luteipulveratus sp. YIM 133296]MDF8265577.1 malto-oligosyltrehalose synthase [Luteipulveratus sp. YIM 133296]
MSRPVTGTYRLQLHAGFTFADAAEQVDYLAGLGVSHLYLSPILQAVRGSMHGYDVTDHSHISEELGGIEGFEALAARAHAYDLGIVVDVVPNHMAFETPDNHQVWQLLKEGRDAPTADWFDIDWKAGGGRIGLPVLGKPTLEALSDNEIRLDELDGEPVLRYFDHVYPVALGTDTGDDVGEILQRQHYRLTSWRDKDEVLNYRRFFEVDGLIAIRVELPEVFDVTHALLLDLHHRGLIDGFRIDHPDGLADPTGYLERLSAACEKGTPVWVEKILEPGERLPRDWRCEGTTGYDAIRAVQIALTDPASAPVLDQTWADADGNRSFETTVQESKRQVVDQSLAPEVERLTRRARETLPDLDPERLREAVVELLVAGEVYRAYVRPDHRMTRTTRARLTDAFAGAIGQRPDLEPELTALIPLTVLADDDEAATDFGIRLQQTWGPVMAKGIEDTSFYRWHRLVALNEVGGDPTVVADASPQALHDWAAWQQEHWPLGMTTLSTHDNKRSEDVRARLLALAGDPDAWAACSAAARVAADEAGVDRPTGHLVWQTLAGVGDIGGERLSEYLRKALREAKVHTAWVDGDEAYEQRVIDLAIGVTKGGPLKDAIDAALEANAGAIAATTLGAKLLQLMLPGVPDTYQGCEVVDLSLVDPDNRRPVDYAARRALTGRDDVAPAGRVGEPPRASRIETPVAADGDSPRTSPGFDSSFASAPDGSTSGGADGSTSGGGDGSTSGSVDGSTSGGGGGGSTSGGGDGSTSGGLDEAKMLVTRTALQLRQRVPELFGAQATYAPVVSSSEHVVGFVRRHEPGLVAGVLGRSRRSAVAVLTTRAGRRLDRTGGWSDATVELEPGTWRDLLTGRTYDVDGPARCADLMATLPVALLERQS